MRGLRGMWLSSGGGLGVLRGDLDIDRKNRMLWPLLDLGSSLWDFGGLGYEVLVHGMVWYWDSSGAPISSSETYGNLGCDQQSDALRCGRDVEILMIGKPWRRALKKNGLLLWTVRHSALKALPW